MAYDPRDLPYGPDTIVIPMTMELPASFVAHMEAMSAPAPRAEPRREPVGAAGGGMARMRPVANPPAPAVLAARWREAMSETAAAEAARRAWAAESRAVIADVRNHPRLVVSGASDGDIKLWRRGSEAAEPQAIAALTLDRDGSQLFAGEKFVGRLFEAEGEALFLPDWLDDIGAGEVQRASDEPEESPESSEKRLLEEEFKRLERAVPLPGGGRTLPGPGEPRDPVLQPAVPIIPMPGTPGRPVPSPQSPLPQKQVTRPQTGAIVTSERKRHILGGQGSAGGHGPGRAVAGKTEFPATWSDDKIIEQIESIANDPYSKRTQAARGRTIVEGTREGVVIRVVIGADGKTIVTAFPTNLPRKP